MLKLINVSASYRRGKQIEYALNNLSLEIKRGERMAITGASGSGKSTLLAVLGAMLKPVEGALFFDGADMMAFSARQVADFRSANVGYVFQNFLLLAHLTVLENLLVPVEHVGIPRPVAEQKARELLERVGMSAFAERYPTEISGGQAQRVAIARALMRSPSMILADEPTGSLDEENAGMIIDLLNQMSDDGTTLVVVTHDQNIANKLGRVIKIERGRMCADSAA